MFLEPLILIVLSFIASTFVSAPQKNLEVGKFLVKSHEIFETFLPNWQLHVQNNSNAHSLGG